MQDELRGDDANGAAPAAEVPAEAATRPDEDLGELQHARCWHHCMHQAAAHLV